MNEPNVGDAPSLLTILLWFVCAIIVAFVLLLPIATLQTDAVYQGF